MEVATEPGGILREFTSAERERWQRQVAAALAERAESDEYFRKAEQAAAEDSFSGELRRAIHAVHDRQMFLPTLLSRAQVEWSLLRPFMMGEGALPSDAIDRLVSVLGLHLLEAAVSTAAKHSD